MPHDLYEILGVPRTASEAEIRHAFWELAKKYHPDTHPGSDDAARRFVEVSGAAETLLDSKLRARYDETHGPAAAASPAAAAPKPQPPKPPKPPKPPAQPASPPRAAPAAETPPTAAPGSGWPRPGNERGDAAKVIASVIAIAAIAGGLIWNTESSARRQGAEGVPNGSLVWAAANFSLDDGYGVNLAGNGARMQILPGSGADIEYTGGYLASSGSLASLPPGETPTYQHCVAAVGQTASQITPTVGSYQCVSGSGGDLAVVEVVGVNSSAVTLDITVWENV